MIGLGSLDLKLPEKKIMRKNITLLNDSNSDTFETLENQMFKSKMKKLQNCRGEIGKNKVWNERGGEALLVRLKWLQLLQHNSSVYIIAFL